eukprot:GHVL01024337.1.p1 GENE.GHVL01024337.1~~GHVL01024337.1.p1  ORF type:complete len:1533 (+),score=264.32 GHVL01024337.1:462-4601(+)
MLGKIMINPKEEEFYNPNDVNLVAQVSRKTETKYINQYAKTHDFKPFHILAVDCGIKMNIIRFFVNILQYPIHLTVVPWNDEFGNKEFDGLFLSNGPGDPVMCQETVEQIKVVMQRGKPIFGICLGNQLLALAAGCKTYKMVFGNRGMNQPVIDCRTTRCFITSQNHGYAVDATTLTPGWLELFKNANDGSNEGIVHAKYPWFSAQFHPEARGGPKDTGFLFEQFLQMVSCPSGHPTSIVQVSIPNFFKKVLILGSGGLCIGQAGEFDYSGSQALKALVEHRIYSVLINPNIATVQTSVGMANRVYFLPISPEFVKEVIKKEKPDGILATFGGQTALNCAVKLYKEGFLKDYGVQVLGTPMQAIIDTEDRKAFAERIHRINEVVAKSETATDEETAVSSVTRIGGYPVLVRAEYALGGMASGIVNNEEELRRQVRLCLNESSQVQIDESLAGWKEIEYEVVRDSKDNCITVCNMENFDPVGVHTGDSIVFAPSLTLTNDEHFKLRETALKVIRDLGVIGECNIQYAVNPKKFEYRIIEVNARLSRSSALASKATGYPLAYVAAKLALGQDLVQIRNSVTKLTTACFEPALDYVVVKVPRFDLQKFSCVDKCVGPSMKSIGEVMSFGRTLPEAIQKALRMVDESSLGFDGSYYDRTFGTFQKNNTDDALEIELTKPTPKRIWAIAKAFELGWSIETVSNLTKIDGYFLSELLSITRAAQELKDMKIDDISKLSRQDTFFLKKIGFSDKHIATILNINIDSVRSHRQRLGVVPFVKQIDTLAAEFPALTNYLYITYNGTEHDVGPKGSPQNTSKDVKYGDVLSRSRPTSSRKRAVTTCDPFGQVSLPKITYGPLVIGSSVIVLGCGSYRIGSSVEFDWTCMSCVRTLRQLGYYAIVVNCNPETVSTDYDESDRLYFEELSFEVVLDIVEFEKPGGIIISVGGQEPNNIAKQLGEKQVNVLGTATESIDRAEDRKQFSELCDCIGVDQPKWFHVKTIEDAFKKCDDELGYPVLVRPSYVLSGGGMRVIPTHAELQEFLLEIFSQTVVSDERPVVLSRYICGAKEVEMDAVAAAGEIVNFAISEHVENAGVHSGDATLILPGQRLYVETIRRVKKISQRIAKELNISGPFNIQYLCKDNDIKVIECNLRASRTFPFISKTFKHDFIELATRIMVRAPYKPAPIHLVDIQHVGVKMPVFSFARLPKADPIVGVEMRSTGEVACFGTNKFEAFIKAFMAAGWTIPVNKKMLLSVRESSRDDFAPKLRTLKEMGYQIWATKGTYEYLRNREYENVICCFKDSEKGEPKATTLIKNKDVDLTINIPDSWYSLSQTDGYLIRRASIDNKIPLITDLKFGTLLIDSLYYQYCQTSKNPGFYIKSWEEYF